MYKNERLELRLTATEMQMLDKVRGSTSRSAWIRNAIFRAHEAELGRVPTGFNKPWEGPVRTSESGGVDPR